MKLACSMMIGAALLLMPGAVLPAQAAPAPPRPAQANAPKPAPEMFLAIGQGDAKGVRALLDSGVSPNVRDTLGATPLMLAAGIGNLEIARMLVDAGAEINASSMFGSALSFATMMGSPEAAKFLLEKGAAVSANRPDKISPLMMAARAGNAGVVKAILDRKAGLHAVDNNGSNALSHAARHGSTAAAAVLLAAGAKVEVADAEGWTPLFHAAVNGRTEIVQLLLKHHAKVNAVDKTGRSALLLTASYGDHPATIRALLKAGATPTARDPKGRTAVMLAQARGYQATAQLLGEKGAKIPAARNGAKRTPRQAAAAALKPIERSMEIFTKRTGCVSCHHEGMGRWATGFAAAKGMKINDAVAREQAKRVAGQWAELKPFHDLALADPSKIKDVPFVDSGDIAPSYGTVLLGMKDPKQASDPATASGAAFLGRMQMPDGAWIFGFQRVPVQSSFFSATAMAVRALQAHAPTNQPAELKARIGKAKEWLLMTPAASTEDRVFRLLGLHWAGASAVERMKAIEELRIVQRPDGGWAQEKGMASDAYATGSSIYALRVAGEVPTADPAVRRGVRFLTRTQEDDGTWYVYKRAIPANNYFDTGFPYGQSQYVSFAATCWAMMALCAADERSAPQVTGAPARPTVAANQ